MKITEVVSLTVGSPQFRIKEADVEEGNLYKFYSQKDMENELKGIHTSRQDNKQIWTLDEVATLNEGDIVFSLVSGMASIVSSDHDGFLFTQNYIVLDTNEKIDNHFLVYLLNEDKFIRRQLQMGLQGSAVLKYTVKLLKELILPELPSMARQEAIGDIYFKQLKLKAITERKANSEMKLRLAQLEEARKNE